MAAPVMTVEGRRVYIAVQYGDPVVPALKNLGAHWDATSKRWWIGSAKKAAVEAAITASAGKPAEKKEDDDIQVVGKARYKGRMYYVRWIGQCRNGEHKARLCSLDGKIDFWAPGGGPEHWAERGDGPVAKMVKEYEEPRSLAGIRQYIERMKADEASGRTASDPRPDEECYRGRTGEWMVRGCSACSALGKMCDRCRFDIYDD